MSAHPTFIIAEIGVNHQGREDVAARLIEAAVRAGADAVKVQTFSPDRLVRADAPLAPYQKAALGGGGGKSQGDMLRELVLSPEAHVRLAAQARGLGVEFLATPFDVESLHFLVRELGVKRLKIGSGDLTYQRLLCEAAWTGLPVIVSTGGSNLGEISRALSALATAYAEGRDAPAFTSRPGLSPYDEPARERLRDRVTLLHCVTAYPAPPAALNLKALETMSRAFNLPVGFSDHSLGDSGSCAAVALGATLIEKHFTLDRAAVGPDHSASLEPAQFAEMVRRIRETESMLGSGVKEAQACELENLKVARRSLVAARDLRAGERLKFEDIDALRPADETPADRAIDWVGKPAPRALRQGEALG